MLPSLCRPPPASVPRSALLTAQSPSSGARGFAVYPLLSSGCPVAAPQDVTCISEALPPGKDKKKNAHLSSQELQHREIPAGLSVRRAEGEEVGGGGRKAAGRREVEWEEHPPVHAVER